MGGNSGRDFFISYTAADEPWAVWIAAVLQQAGFSTVVQAQDFPPGADFIYRMQNDMRTATRTIAVLSPDYFNSRFGEAEWRATFVKDPTGELGLLIPVRVRRCAPPGLLASRIYIDLVGHDEPAARRLLLDGVGPVTRRYTTAATSPAFPGHRAIPDDQEPEQVPEPSTGAGVQPAKERLAQKGEDPTSEQGAGADQAPEQGTWADLDRRRPKFADLLGDDVELVGHADLQGILRAQLDNPETAALVLLSGPAGSGKSAVVRWLKRVAAARVVDARAARDALTDRLRDDGSDVRRLLRGLRLAVTAAGARAVLVYDDADHDLREPGIARLVSHAISQLDLGFLVICTSTPVTPELFPIPATSLDLDRRRADFPDFDRLLDRMLDAAGEHRDAFSADLRRSLHDMAEQTVDFRAVQYVVEMLIAHRQWTGQVTRPAVLRHLLDTDQVRQLQLPAVHIREGRLSFRRRDKSELLAQLLLRHFPTPRALADSACRSLEDFDETAFLREAEQPAGRSFWDAVMSLCLTNSPRDLVLELLDDDQIRQEIDALKLDPARLIDKRGEQAHLLIRSLGFTLADTPKGLTALKDAVQNARAVVEDANARTDVIKAAGAKITEHVDSALRDLLHFWATYLFESVRELVKAYNARHLDSDALDRRRRPTTQEVVRLLRFVNVAAEAEGSTYCLSFPEGGSPVSGDLLNDCHRFTTAAEAFERAPGSATPSDPAPLGLRNHFGGLVETATAVLGRASESTYPTVIKLTEIVFDEYSRRIFRGVDSDNNEVRFGLTENEERDDLVVAAHYFMLPQRRVSVNPHIVPLTRTAAGTLFDRPSDYEEASSTQRRQGERLLELVELRPDDVVVEVGAGTGTLAIEVARHVQRVLGIDKSPDMVRQAELNARDAGISNVTFEIADLLDYETGPWFDLVLSNSSMHWILPEDRAYQQLFRLLRRGGRLGVHQGGRNTYRGLHEHAFTLVRELGYEDYFRGWRYPTYYPSAEEFRQLLERVGFDNVVVEPEESDGSRTPNLVHDFAEAGLLPYLHQLPETQRDSFRAEFLEEAKRSRPDLYTHRLYAVATRP